ncbi:MAG TPA: FAD-dependent oxidoreductase [Nitrospirales bacterium]|nr:FAD-dependent oxidoreductase [Nitrospirales bacterium]
MGEPTQRAKVTRARMLSPTVRELVLIPLESKISFKPGQWVSLKLPVGERLPLTRAYSMAEPESSSGRLVLAFDRVPDGLGSGYLSSVKEGDELILAGPYGNFTVHRPLTVDLVLVAHFTGIVPIRCILRDLFAGSVSYQVTLIYGSPTQTEQIYHDELQEMAASHKNFRYLPTVLDGSGPAGEERRSESEVLASLWQGRKDFLPMVCGTKAFIRPLKTYLSELGFGRKEAKFETYD